MSSLGKKAITPICCILGHVDVGKTKLLDYLRHTSTKEVSGITQQIGTTYFSKSTLETLCGPLGKNLSIPAMIMVDTPGHDCFTTMRHVGAIISNLVIVVIDINKGLEKETINCLNFVRDHHGTKFVIVLNKLDKIYGWESCNGAPLKQALEHNKALNGEIMHKINNIICQLAELKINACAYYENKDVKTFVSMVPLSASSGEGIPDLIMLISKMMEIESKRAMENPLSLHPYGYFIDQRYEDNMGTFNISVNINGTVVDNDDIVIIDRDDRKNVIRTKIRNLVMSGEGKEMKDNAKYKYSTSIEGTQGVGIVLTEQLKITPSSMYAIVTGLHEEEIQNVIELMDKTIITTDNSLMHHYNKSSVGVFLSAPSINMISGLIKTSNDEGVQIYDHHIGKISKELIIKTSSIYSRFGKESYKREYLKRYAVIMLFDPVINHGDDKEMLEHIDEQVRRLALESEITIIVDKTVYKLVAKYKEYVKKLDDEFFKKYPNIGHKLKLQILPQYIFLKTTPLLFGVKVLEGELKQHLIVCAKKENKEVILGRITSIQKNKKNIDVGKVNDELCIRIENGTEKFTYDVDFDKTFIITRYMNLDEQTVDRFVRSLKV